MTKQKKRRVSKKVGLPPGTLVYTGTREGDGVRISLFHYDENGLEEKALERAEDCAPYKDAPRKTWINVDGVHDLEILKTIGRAYDLHPLVLEDIVNTRQRPKIEDYGGCLFVVLKMLTYRESSHRVVSEQISLILGPSYVLSFQEWPGDVFDPVRQRLRDGGPRMRKGGSDYLFYALFDTIVDHYFTVLEKLDEEMEVLEERSLTDLSPQTLQKIHRLRRELIAIRRSAWPMREIPGGLERNETGLIRGDTHLFIRDTYDHIVQLIDILESLRDRLSGVQDIHLSGVSNNMNSVMKALAVIGTIFLPLTFLAGVYGMNFKAMPELEWKWGYPAALLLMLGVGIGMFYLFKKKDWL